MSRDWESTFSSWTSRASDSEEARYERTRKRIDEVLRADARLAEHDFRVYPKGSYPNFTNVVADSDVDIAVELRDMFGCAFVGAAEEANLKLEDVGEVPYLGNYSLGEFKNDVEGAMRREFGPSVDRGDKAIHITATETRLAADVVPCRWHRTWNRAPLLGLRVPSIDGIELLSDRAPHIDLVNYPEQHKTEGIAKNDRTGRRFKRTVRILKRLENEMVAREVIDEVPSFLIESAVSCVPNDRFVLTSNWASRVREVLVYIWNGTGDSRCIEDEDWTEVNRMKFLFHDEQPWSHEDINRFVWEAYQYIGYE
jgi:hypothetical protein